MSESLPPHFRCDCVPDLGPAHCHRCSRLSGAPVPWTEAGCVTLVETPAYRSLLTTGDEALLLRASKTFDAEQEAEHEAPALPESPARPCAVPAPPKTRLVFASRGRSRGRNDSCVGRRFTNLARAQLNDLNVTERQVAAFLDSPHVQAPAQSGGAVNHYSDDLLVMADASGECVISVIKREADTSSGTAAVTAGAAGVTAGAVKQKTHHGGAGRRIPSTLKEILAMLTEHGFTSELSGSGHRIVAHPAHPDVRITIPSSPSDRRSYLNAVALIRRRTGIDITKAK